MVLSKPKQTIFYLFFYFVIGYKRKHSSKITQKRRTKSELLILMLLDLHVSFSFFVNDLLAHISLSQFIALPFLIQLLT